MINTTDRLEVLVKDSALGRLAPQAIARAINIVEPRLGLRPDKFAFRRLFERRNLRTETRFDRAFVSAAVQFCMVNTRDAEAGRLLKVLQSYAGATPLPATTLPGLKRGLKLMLVELWRQRALLLPTIFSPGTQFPMQDFDHELLAWIHGLDPSVKTEGRGRYNGDRLYYNGPRLLFAADWQSVEDVSLNDVAAIHRAQTLYRNGKSAQVIAGGTYLPCSMFVSLLQKTFPDRASFTEQDLKRYSTWALTHSIERVSFEEYTPKRWVRKSRARAGRETTGRRRRSVDHAALVADAVQKNTHEAILTAYHSLQRGRPREVDWRATDLPSYPGREYVDMRQVAPLWIDSFKAFLHHRKHVKEYRSSDETVSCLNLLADYLFFYLPWWKQLCPLGKVDLPVSPRLFSRYAFVARHVEVPIDELPATLLQLIAVRRPSKESTSIAVHQLAKYFEFVGTYFAEDERIAGRGFVSPLNSDLDTPRLKKRTKTTKQIIPKNLYGHLLFYCYAVEKFGEHLQQCALQNRLDRNRLELRNALRFNCSDFEQCPVVTYRGKEMPINGVPNVFTWAERQVTVDDAGETVSMYMPHITALRIIIASLETGLRFQSIQWLDRMSWDSGNVNVAPDSYTCTLFVNTDKTREQPWTTYVVYRVRALLQREQKFQESFADVDQFGPVGYEGLDASPFDPIRPLFRASARAYPVNDNTYAEAWIRLMIGFEEFYAVASGEQHVQMTQMKVITDAHGAPVVRFRDNRGRGPYCAISIQAIHTPHACRATFATNRQGVLELSDTAELLGHRSVEVTAYYTKPSGDALRERLRESDLAIIADYTMFDASCDAHIRADRPESALVRSFSRDREGAVRRFRFMPPIALWSTESASGEGEGLKLLREGPMSRIRFRETHICPVGEECPADVIEKIGAPKRCGACPLAMKCVDHLPAIAAKKNQLLERIRYLHRRRKMLEESGEPAAVLDEIWEELELDINELLGWQVSEEVLTSLLKNIEADDAAGKVLHVDRPEIVRRHLQKVTRSCNGTELMLQRIADSNAYPSLTTPQVQAAAAQLKRRLLAGRNVDEIQSWTGDLDDVRVTAKQLALMMKTAGLSVSDVAKMLTVDHAARPEPVLLSQGK